jgi:hypothetical protein
MILFVTLFQFKGKYLRRNHKTRLVADHVNQDMYDGRPLFLRLRLIALDRPAQTNCIEHRGTMSNLAPDQDQVRRHLED